MSGKTMPPATPSSFPSLSPGERFLEVLAEDLDLEKSIKKLNISKDEARELLRGFIKAKRPLPPRASSEAAASKVTEDKAAPPEAIVSKHKGEAYDLYVDGGSRGNPGPSGAGAVIKGPDGTVVKRLKKRLGIGTNNRAEYMALIMALEAAHKLGAKRVHVFADSELVVRQISGRYKVKSPLLQPLYREARDLLSSFTAFRISHIPRAQNSDADGLANEAMDGGA